MTHRGEGANIRYVSIEGLSVGRVASKKIEYRLVNLFSSILGLNKIPSGEVDDGNYQQTDRQTEALNTQCNEGQNSRCKVNS